MRDHFSGRNGANASATGEVFALRQPAQESGGKQVSCTSGIHNTCDRRSRNRVNVIACHYY
jgi:hypothetical protein